MTTLKAKSGKGGRPGRTLAEHTFDVVDSLGALFGTPEKPTRLARRWTAFFRLKDLPAFLRNGIAAALVHDWGKANDGMQAVLDGTGTQLLRHECLSGMLLHLPDVKRWIGERQDLDHEVILSAVITHHLKASYGAFGAVQGESDSALKVHWDHPDFQQLLARTATRLGLTTQVPALEKTLWSFEPQPGDFDAAKHLASLKRRLDDFDEDLQDDEPRRRLLWAVRAALIAADSAASGLVRENHTIAAWIESAFDESAVLDGDAVWAKVITPRVEELKAKRRWESWTDFQVACDALPDRALLLAPCGSGKTLAAWRWIAARLNARPAARVLFLYPTRGTATEGFRDYVAWAPEADAALVHGTAPYDLDGLFDDAEDDPRRGRSYESNARLFALKQWPKRIFSATVDQFLAFLQYGYGPVCHLPLLADSVVVADEVHSYDGGMFSALQDLLRAFDVPVLCMTATLPEERRKALEECGLEVYPRVMPADLRASADYPRYRVRATTKELATQEVRRALADKKRVLWVVNKVRYAQELARAFALDPSANDLEAAPGVPVFCYHSRFKLEDRKRQHEAVVEAFKRRMDSPLGAALAVTTQVCEMSLDLDADLLVTEGAPATALIQRMGRCCREKLPKKGRFGEVLIYPFEDEKPYRPEQLEGVPAFIEQLTRSGRVTQVDLEAALAAAPQPAEVPKECRFLASGPWAMAGEESFRETDEFTRPAVLPEDVGEFEELRRSKDKFWKADGLVLPIPVYLARGKDDRLPSYLFVAGGGYYRAALGYCKGAPGALIV